MNDRELLELAAKAAGIEVRWHSDSHYGPTMEIMEDESGGPPWNPLTDDGDAFRLAVKLKICIYPETGTAEWKRADDDWVANSVFDSDPYAATRRAIVRAAAEIGRSMK